MKIYKHVKLPKDKWYTCKVCKGKGYYYMEGDLHKSGGTVPCQHCHVGTVKTKIVEVK